MENKRCGKEGITGVKMDGWNMVSNICNNRTSATREEGKTEREIGPGDNVGFSSLFSPFPDQYIRFILLFPLWILLLHRPCDSSSSPEKTREEYHQENREAGSKSFTSKDSQITELFSGYPYQK